MTVGTVPTRTEYNYGLWPSDSPVSGAASLRRRRIDAKNQIDVLSARLTRKLYTENKEKAEGGITVHGMHCRETETGSPQCTGSPPSRKVEK